MEQAFQVHGAVLKHRAVGEYDWLVTLLTAERGKISAFARGARKPAGRLSGNVEPLSFGSFTIANAYRSYVLTEARIDNYFEAFRRDLCQAAYGSYYLETADHIAQENLEALEMLNLLYVTLRATERKENAPPHALIRCVFELRLMMQEGEYPGSQGLMPFSQAVGKAFSHIEQAPLTRLYSFSLKPEALAEFLRVSAPVRKRFLDFRPKSLEMLKMYEGEDGLY